MDSISIKVPATSANLGPGFDCLGIALSLWNTTEFHLGGSGLQVSVEGEGADDLPRNHENAIVQAAIQLYKTCGKTFPENIKIHCENHIPLGSGLGSSSAAILSGLLGANGLLGNPLSEYEILKLGVGIEGHPDNIAPALLDGLIISSMHEGEVLTAQVQIPEWTVSIVLPDIALSTAASRAVLPEQVFLKDAVKNIGNAALLVQALQSKDINLLRVAINDQLHQPYRLPLIPGSQEAIDHANRFGGAAALSGAGPSVIVFTETPQPTILKEIEKTFLAHGISIRKSYQLTTL